MLGYELQRVTEILLIIPSGMKWCDIPCQVVLLCLLILVRVQAGGPNLQLQEGEVLFECDNEIQQSDDDSEPTGHFELPMVLKLIL
jgi:hypothetical protein